MADTTASSKFHNSKKREGAVHAAVKPNLLFFRPDKMTGEFGGIVFPWLTGSVLIFKSVAPVVLNKITRVLCDIVVSASKGDSTSICHTQFYVCTSD